MVHIKKFYEDINNEEVMTCRYNSLEISPVHIHKNKKCHKDALLTLGEEVVMHIRGNRQMMVEYAPAEIAVEH
jgi:hypothetical protein